RDQDGGEGPEDGAAGGRDAERPQPSRPLLFLVPVLQFLVAKPEGRPVEGATIHDPLHLDIIWRRGITGRAPSPELYGAPTMGSPRAQRSSRLTTSAARSIDPVVIGSRTSWTWPMPSSAIRFSTDAISCGDPVIGWCSTWRPSPESPKLRNRATVRSSVFGSRRAFSQASSMWARSGASPSGELAKSLNQEFHIATCGRAIESMRGELEPIMNGIPPGRDSGRSWASSRR